MCNKSTATLPPAPPHPPPPGADTTRRLHPGAAASLRSGCAGPSGRHHCTLTAQRTPKPPSDHPTEGG
eukprot:5223490-Prymnesium_polylepis.1